MSNTKDGKNTSPPETEEGKNSVSNQSTTDISGQDSGKSLSLKNTEKKLKKHDFKVDEKERAVKLNVLMLPSVQGEFKRVAEEQGLSFSEFIRRAAFAAKHDPSILHSEGVKKSESEYQKSSRSSRWTRANEL